MPAIGAAPSSPVELRIRNSWARIEELRVLLWASVQADTDIPRPADRSVMPISSLGFWLKPAGFFERNSALDVPALKG